MSAMGVSTASQQSTSITIPDNWRLWRFDTRAIIGGVLLAVCFSVNMQITERIDTALTGGIWVPMGIAFQVIWFSATVFFFGLGAGLITAWFNPFVAILTATGPLAPAWFMTNGSFAVTFAVLMRTILTRFKTVSFWPFFWTVWVSNIGTGVIIAALHLFILKLAPWIVLSFFVGNQLVTIPTAALAFYFCRSISRSGIAT